MLFFIVSRIHGTYNCLLLFSVCIFAHPETSVHFHIIIKPFGKLDGNLIGLGSEARMNTPSSLGGNWQWRADAKKLTPALAAEIRVLTERYFRAAK